MEVKGVKKKIVTELAKAFNQYNLQILAVEQVKSSHIKVKVHNSKGEPVIVWTALTPNDANAYKQSARDARRILQAANDNNSNTAPPEMKLNND